MYQVIHKQHIPIGHSTSIIFQLNIAQARPMSVSDGTTQLAKVEFQPPLVVVTADVFQFFIKYHGDVKPF